MFIYKPTLYIPFKDIESVSFDRVGGAVGVTRTFDLRVLLRSLDGDVRREYIFAQVCVLASRAPPPLEGLGPLLRPAP
jgi:hypothetical protein